MPLSLALTIKSPPSLANCRWKIYSVIHASNISLLFTIHCIWNLKFLILHYTRVWNGNARFKVEGCSFQFGCLFFYIVSVLWRKGNWCLLLRFFFKKLLELLQVKCIYVCVSSNCCISTLGSSLMPYFSQAWYDQMSDCKLLVFPWPLAFVLGGEKRSKRWHGATSPLIALLHEDTDPPKVRLNGSSS